MDAATILGSLAALCTMVSFAPQAWKIIRTRDTSGLSTPMYAVSVMAFALWLVFGVMKQEWPIIIPNGVCLALAAFIFAMTILPPRKKAAVADKLDPRHAGTGWREPDG